MAYADKQLQGVKKQELIIQEAIDSFIKQQNEFQIENIKGNLLGAVTMLLQISYTVGALVIDLCPVKTLSRKFVYKKALEKAPDVADYIRQKIPGLKGSSGLKQFPLNFAEQKGTEIIVKQIMLKNGMKGYVPVVELLMGSLENMYKTFQVGNMIKNSVSDQLRLNHMYSYRINQLKQRLSALKNKEKEINALTGTRSVMP